MIANILKHYTHISNSSRNGLLRILSNGKLCGSGKLLILPVDQGFEHGPDESFFMNSEAYNPVYHVDLAIQAGVSAYAAPLGMIDDVSHKYSSRIPLILKLNSSTKLFPVDNEPEQAFISTPSDAVKLGCVGVGITIYPGSSKFKEMLEISAKKIKEAKELGLFVVVWSYPRGGDISAKDETALDIISYGAHIACLIGADIIKVKPPENLLSRQNSENFGDISSLENRARVIKRSCFAGKRIVLFSGGKSKDLQSLYREVKSLRYGGADGSIIGRNAFQRPQKEALEMLNEIINIYKSNL